MRLRTLAAITKAVEPEAEVFCSTAARTLLLLHSNADHFEVDASQKNAIQDPKQAASRQIPMPLVLRNGRTRMKNDTTALLLQAHSRDRQKIADVRAGREVVSLALLSPLLSSRLEESRRCREQGTKMHTPDVLGRKYMDHIETCVIQHAARRQLALRARGMDVDPTFQLFPFVTHTPCTSAATLASMICHLIEKDIPIRRIWSQVETMYRQTPEIRGIRVACAGRTSRASTKAKTLNYRVGSTSLAVFSRDVDYGAITAATRRGSVGLKVWIAFH